MKKIVVAAVAVLSATLPVSVMAATPTLTVKTWTGIPTTDYFPTEASITAEMAYASATTPSSTAILSESAASYTASLGASTAMDFSGALNVATAGLYTFYVNADDAARISIDGSTVVENTFNGNSSLNSPQTAQIFLSAGAHNYDAFTFQQGGGQYYTATINGAGNVYFTPNAVASAAVPEPASWAMMVGGFGMLGAALRRKKANVSFA